MLFSTTSQRTSTGSWWHCKDDNENNMPQGYMQCHVRSSNSPRPFSSRHSLSTRASRLFAQTCRSTAGDLRALTKSMIIVLLWVEQNTNISLRASLLAEHFPLMSFSVCIGIPIWIPMSNHLFRASLSTLITSFKLDSISVTSCSWAAKIQRRVHSLHVPWIYGDPQFKVHVAMHV